MCASILAAMPEIYFTYPGWKRKALTFSFDDGVTEDRKLVEIFNRYGMKATFNVSAGRAGRLGKDGKTVRFIPLSEYAALYKGHEIASHGFRHLNMKDLSPAEMEEEIRRDLAELEKVAGYPIRGFAYPYGQTSDEVRAMLKKYGIVYARGTGETGKFYEEKDPFYWQMSGHSFENLPLLAEKYRDYNGWGGVLSVCSVWGHSYEFEDAHNWDVIENFCKTLANRPDVWYATNVEIVDYMSACRKMQMSADGNILVNPTAIPVYLWIDGKNILLEPEKSVALTPVEGIVYPDGSYPVFPGGRPRALTFSEDDGKKESDAKLAALFDRYELKGTFNVNSKRDIDYSIYRNHEVATHGFRHGSYQCIPKEEILFDILRDRENIEKQVGYIVRGNAWPNGANWSDFPAAREVYAACNIVYSRSTAERAENFAIPSDWLAWHPTAHHTKNGDILKIADDFLTTDKIPALCMIWGHPWEFDREGNWEVMENFAKKVAHRPDVWYATNIEIYDYMQAVASLQWSCDRSFCRNMSAIPVYYVVEGKLFVIQAGETVFFKGKNQ
ncbi:MAG: polysaccharide deacetylase family protein [Victivallaceae bacterium]|nr:polysaccharide deacetylase family protein [Victivallaceae bacterium]